MSCLRCGNTESRIDGFCSIYCRDIHEVESELAEARELLRIAWSEIQRPDLANRVDAFLTAYDEARKEQA